MGNSPRSSCDKRPLICLTRRMSRRRRPRGHAPSGGYRREAARLHKRAQRQNTHAARVWAKRVVAEHQTIAVEDFQPRFLARSTMARKAADAAIAAAKRELIERGVRAGRRVVLVPPAYTTMTCSECFAIAKQRLGLAERVFRCERCGYTADRDRNAARTILATVDPDRAGADDVRHCLPPPQDASGAVRARNPRLQPWGRVKSRAYGSGRTPTLTSRSPIPVLGHRSRPGDLASTPCVSAARCVVRG
jgi:putative transposase